MNTIRFAFRSLFRDRAYAFLNIGGLALGIACFIILALNLRHELSYDQYNVDHERIFRVNHEVDYGNSRNRRAQTSHFLGPLLQRYYAQIDNYVTFRRASRSTFLLTNEGLSYQLDGVYIADNSAFAIFSHDVIFGDPVEALTKAGTIAISESVSSLFFGSGNPIGETLSTGLSDLTVTLVYKDQPDNTHFKYRALIANQGILAPSASALDNSRGRLWSLNAYTYVLMSQGFDKSIWIDDAFPEFFDAMMAGSTRPGYRARFFLEPLSSIHLDSVAQRDFPRGNIFYLYAFSAVALFVVLIACINYVNLSTARAVKRSREIAIRRILGASRPSLIFQFLVESILCALIALAVAVAGVEFLSLGSMASDLFGKALTLNLRQDTDALLSLLALGLTVGLVAGAYPALFLARMKTGEHTAAVSSRLRKFLVFVQFAISIAVMSATGLMYSQMDYINDKPLGFDKNNKLLIDVQGAGAIERIQTFKDRLLTSPKVNNVSMVTGNPLTNRSSMAVDTRRDDGTTYNLDADNIGVDSNFITTLGLKLIEGRTFDKFEADDKKNYVIINQAVANEVGWKNPIGKTWKQGDGNSRTVIGVVEDFHYESLHKPIGTIIFYHDLPDYKDASPLSRLIATRELIVDIASDTPMQTLSFIQEEWQKFEPRYPFRYEFLIDKVRGLYVDDNREMQLIGVFAAVCIFISCLGLFGFSAFVTSQRTKEIGIRKILGASTLQIVFMLFRSVLGYLLVAALMGCVIAFVGISGWLEGFYYRQEMDPAVFVAATAAALAISLSTIAIQSYRTANQNPVNALRYE